MSEPIDIPLHADTPPGVSQLLGWVLGANIFVLVTVTLVFVVLPWMAGHQPKPDATLIAIAGATGIALMVGFLGLSFRRHRRKSVKTPSARLSLDADNARVIGGGGAEHICPRDEFVARPVHAHETLRGVDYYMGPALELRIGEQTWVVATMDGRHCWAHDPPSVQRIDWICTAEAWTRLLAAEDLSDSLIPYATQVT